MDWEDVKKQIEQLDEKEKKEVLRIVFYIAWKSNSRRVWPRYPMLERWWMIVSGWWAYRRAKEAA